ncbi:MAG: N-acetylneuraminate synthase [Rhodocyclales bacterium CG_4_9_14_3_um_filter_68_10]|nr:MAG: N-acetylneuraminate synthase [Rhodocyclales bacterium CG_4_9_14_3_um_filter_68_10]
MRASLPGRSTARPVRTSVRAVARNQGWSASKVQIASFDVPQHVFVIAEIGINHNGEIEIAKRLIDMAMRCGCDAVKFQKRSIDIVYTKEMLDSPRESPWGATQRAQKEGLEFGKAEYDEIDRQCRQRGIEWFASAWDIPSQLFLRDYGLKRNKIASAMVTHPEFLEVVAEEKKPVFLSTGMCTYEEIDRAVAVFGKQGCPVTLMHAVSEYPAPEEILNIACMHALRERYGLPVGYSGHEASVSPSVIAAAHGAVAIERHVTLDRAMYGSDQSASLEEAGLRDMVAMIRKIAMVLGDGEKRITVKEEGVASKLRYWNPR